MYTCICKYMCIKQTAQSSQRSTQEGALRYVSPPPPFPPGCPRHLCTPSPPPPEAPLEQRRKKSSEMEHKERESK